MSWFVVLEIKDEILTHVSSFIFQTKGTSIKDALVKFVSFPLIDIAGACLF